MKVGIAVEPSLIMIMSSTYKIKHQLALLISTYSTRGRAIKYLMRKHHLPSDYDAEVLMQSVGVQFPERLAGDQRRSVVE